MNTNNNNDVKMDPKDLLFYEEGGVVKSLGYKINNNLINKTPAMFQKGGGVNITPYVVPAGLYMLQRSLKGENPVFELNKDVDVVGADLYSTLVNMNKLQKRKSHGTRKKKSKSFRKTKKQKK